MKWHRNFILCVQLLNVSAHLAFHVIVAHVASRNLAIHVSHVPFCRDTYLLTVKSKLCRRVRRILEFKTHAHTTTGYVTLERSSYVKNTSSPMGRLLSTATQHALPEMHAAVEHSSSLPTRMVSVVYPAACTSQELLTVAEGRSYPSIHFEEPREEMRSHSGARLSYVICNLKLNRSS